MIGITRYYLIVTTPRADDRLNYFVLVNYRYLKDYYSTFDFRQISSPDRYVIDTQIDRLHLMTDKEEAEKAKDSILRYYNSYNDMDTSTWVFKTLVYNTVYTVSI